MSRGRRHTLALGAAQNVHSGMAPDAALAAALDGKTLAASDRTLVEQEMAEILERNPPKLEPGPAPDVDPCGPFDPRNDMGPWVQDDDGSMPEPTAEDVRAEIIAEVDATMGGAGFVVAPLNHDPVIAPPGAAERDAEVERIAAGTASRAKHERRTVRERLADATADLEAARIEVRRLQFLLLADTLATFAPSKPAATVLRSAVNAGFWAEAESVARRGCTAAGIAPPQWVSEHVGPHTLRLDVERATTVDEDDCEVFVDGRKVAVIGLADVVGELQIVAFGPDGLAEANARRELAVTIGGGA